MAGRPIKQGVDYFPLNTDFFYDVKVRKILRACGPNAASVLICLLCNIYRDKGYYIVWDEDLPFCIADEVGVSEGCVKEVLLKAVQVGFFDVEKHSAHGILTSNGIQKRFLEITRQRKAIEIKPDFSINHVKNSINHVKNEQSKVKESNKENPPIGGTKKDAALAATLSRKEDFYQSLVPFVGKYEKDMIRAFFDYWSEMNKSCTKMRFEQQPTWEVAKRLATWASRNNQFNRDNGTNRKNYPTSEQRAADAASIIARLAAEDDAAGK